MTPTMSEVVAAHPLFAGWPAGAQLVVGCGRLVAFAPGTLLVAEGEPAHTLYLLRRGAVSVELHSPGAGPLVVDRIGPGGVVGWSWLYPPRRWHFDARALEPVGAVAVDGACLSAKARSDPAFGYELMCRLSAVLLDRLQATRLRLLDLYGPPAPPPPPLGRTSAGPLPPAPPRQPPTTSRPGHLPVRPMGEDPGDPDQPTHPGHPGHPGGLGVPHPLDPVLHRVLARRQETADVVTFSLEPLSTPPLRFRCGQFAMLTAFGVGEVPVSIASAPGQGPLQHTVRDVGAVTHALCRAAPGTILGVRGPFGTPWDPTATDWDPSATDPGAPPELVVVAGGLGLAPLRGAVQTRLARPGAARRTWVLVGARSPDQVLFAHDLARWQAAGAHVAVTVDQAAPGWTGPVGVVTGLLTGASFHPERARALVCGPEVMMRFVARDLVDRGIPAEHIRLSLERNMQCALGTCGHCQLGPILLCRDGPVVSYGPLLETLLAGRER